MQLKSRHGMESFVVVVDDDFVAVVTIRDKHFNS